VHGAELVGEVHPGGEETGRNLEETAALLESECMRISMVEKYVNYVIKYKL